MRNPLRAIFVASAVLCTGGCANYPAVGSLSGSMQQALTTWKPFAADYEASCRRRLSISQAFGSVPSTCEEAAAVSVGLDNAIIVLENYAGALQAVATDDKFNINPGIDALATSASKDLKFDSAKTSAISGLAKVLSNLVLSGIRAHALQKLIDQAPNAEDVVGAIQQVIATDYAHRLDLESGEWTAQMGPVGLRTHLQLPPCSGAKIQPPVLGPQDVTGENVLYQQYYVDRCNLILARRAAIAEFNAAAEQLKTGLEDLQSSKTRLKSKVAIEALYKSASQLLTATGAVQRAFAKGSANV
jgi:hypothetical protein